MNYLWLSVFLLIGCLWFFENEAKAVAQSIYVPPAIDIQRVVDAIKAVEGWDGIHQGRAGERGAMQFTESAWKEYSIFPFYLIDESYPNVKAEVCRVEQAHIIRMITRCYELKLKPSVYLLALLHNAGVEAVRNGTASAMKKDFAQRVENTYSTR